MSAAMTRLLAKAARVSQRAILDEIDRTGHIPVRDPWLGDTSRGLYVSLRLGPPARLVRQLLPPQAPQTPQFRFYLVYRLWPEMLTDGTRCVLLDFPADTRAPNHSLFEHLSQVSALTACYPCPALLLVSVGPVQSFIATARKTADLLAGSYLLSYLVWKGMEAIVEDLGPDHFIFPSVFHLGLFDWWLLRRMGGLNPRLSDLLGTRPYPWQQVVRIANIPNRMLALIPWAGEPDWLRRVCECIQAAWRGVLRQALVLAYLAVEKRGAMDLDEAVRQSRSMRLDDPSIRKWVEEVRQDAEPALRIQGVAIPLDLQGTRQGQDLLGKKAVEELLRTYGEWVSGDDRTKLIRDLVQHLPYPDPPVTLAYALVYHLIERWHAATKASPPPPTPTDARTGRRCSLCGERVEIGTVWARVRGQAGNDFHSVTRHSEQDFWGPLRTVSPGWPVLVRSGEFLCAVCWTKRVFLHLLEAELGEDLSLARFPSTQEIGAFPAKRAVLEAFQDPEVNGQLRQKLQNLVQYWQSCPHPQALKTQTAEALRRSAKEAELAELQDEVQDFIHMDGAWLRADESDIPDLRDETGLPEDWIRGFLNKLKDLKSTWEKVKGTPFPAVHAYYALVMMDGDRMGEWLSGRRNPRVEEALHPAVVEAIRGNPETAEILDKTHPMSPAWHTALSRRLSEFATREVLRLCLETYDVQLVYAGGDDVLLMAPVPTALRIAHDIQAKFRERVLVRGSMSAGIVFAHVKYPLSLALQEVRAAEEAAKRRRGRDAFELRILKRSGERLTTGWHWTYGEPPVRVVDVVEALAGAFQEGWLSTRFAYQLAAALTELGVYGVAGAEGVSLNANLRDTVRSLLRLHFRRALDPKLDDAQKGFMQDKVLGPLESLLEVASSAHDFMDLIMAVAFRVRPEETGA
jgi:CRISPR-associated protein Cmr2